MSYLGYTFYHCSLKRKLKENNKNDKIKLKTLNIDEIFEIGPFKLKAIRTSHSIPDPVSILISTKTGNIFHSGDWKLDNSSNINENIDINDFRSLGKDGILAMVCDSTNALVEGRTPSEDFAYNGLMETILM